MQIILRAKLFFFFFKYNSQGRLLHDPRPLHLALPFNSKIVNLGSMQPRN